MNLTLGQVREALQISQECLRHWKSVLSPLASQKGRQARLTLNDLLALAIIKSLTDDFGIPVGNLDQLSRTLFEQCEKQSWTKFERLAALIHPGDWSIAFFSASQIPGAERSAILIPCAPIVAALRATLMTEQSDDSQEAFRFPLASVNSKRGGQNS